MKSQWNTEWSLEGLWEQEQNALCRGESWPKSHISEIQKSRLEVLVLNLLLNY